MPLSDLRFQAFDALTPEQREERLHAYHRANLGAPEVRPILRSVFEPFAASLGFRRAATTLLVRRVEPHYVHAVSIVFRGKTPGRFYVKLGVAVDFLLHDNAFELKAFNFDTDCLFLQTLRLPTGTPEFDNGTTVEEATETVQLLNTVFATAEQSYFSRFNAFPDPLATFGVPELQKLESAVHSGVDHEFGRWGATVHMLAYRIALVHRFIGNIAHARDVAEYAAANAPRGPLSEALVSLISGTASPN